MGEILFPAGHVFSCPVCGRYIATALQDVLWTDEVHNFPKMTEGAFRPSGKTGRCPFCDVWLPEFKFLNEAAMERLGNVAEAARILEQRG